MVHLVVISTANAEGARLEGFEVVSLGIVFSPETFLSPLRLTEGKLPQLSAW